MPEGQSPLEVAYPRRRPWPQRKRWRFTIGFLLLMIAMLAYAWFTREQIARDVIAQQLESLNLPATYELGEIGADRQVLHNLVIGDPDRPDFTAKSVAVELTFGVGAPSIGRVELTSPRLFGSYDGSELSFGSLDPVIFAENEESAGLPDLEVVVIDGRGLVEGSFGDVGLAVEGSGHLRNGFAGTLAASLEDFSAEGCAGKSASIYSKVSTEGGEVRLRGPLRLRGLSCDQGSVELGNLDWELETTLAQAFNAVESGGALVAEGLSIAGVSSASVSGEANLAVREGVISLRHDLAATKVTSPILRLERLGVEGSIRTRSSLERLDASLSLSGRDVRLGNGVRTLLNVPESSSPAAFFDPILAKLRRGLAMAERSNSLSGSVAIRMTESEVAVSSPQIVIRGPDQRAFMSVSQMRSRWTDDDGIPQFSFNLATQGADLPRISARMEQVSDGRSAMRVRMEPYLAGSSRIALPDLLISQDKEQFEFDGRALLSGELGPDMRVEALDVPINGQWSAERGLALILRCAKVQASSFGYASVTLVRPVVEICPSRNAPALRLVEGETHYSGRITPLALSGTLSGDPLTITSGRVDLDSVGGLSAQQVDVRFGPDGDSSRFAIQSLQGDVTGAMRGTFSGGQMALNAVPIDISEGSGTWQVGDGVLHMKDIFIAVTDRERDPRFERLIANGAAVRFDEGVIHASGVLQEPYSQRDVMQVRIIHTLETGEGQADLTVDGLHFDETLQPAAGSDVCLNRSLQPADFRPATPGLSCLVLGVVANVDGAVSGKGEIVWTPQAVASQGIFSTEGADLAAAFGPVKGASGTVRFTDLLALTTAPDQRITIKSINPGIEVFDGEVAFSLSAGETLLLERGLWPFMGGELVLEPVAINFTRPETRRYVFRIEGLDAAQFIQQMELGNISADGVFDGAVPIVFDELGNGEIERGTLFSRVPGGNLSYIGELTYEDLGAIGNYAFSSLRSLDFRTMEVVMNGPLTGEIVTELKFQGISQGEGASRNFITKQIAKLPVEFRVNIRAPFYQLITSIQSMYDPAFVRDPRDLGLLESDGERFRVPQTPEMPALRPDDLDSDEPSIQPQESEGLP